MRKLWLCLFYALCVFTIVFSLFWMALPRREPGQGHPEQAEHDGENA